MLENYKTLKLNQIELDFHRETFVMGILNVTPDSFLDGGQFNSIEKAIAQAKKMVADGAIRAFQMKKKLHVSFR